MGDEQQQSVVLFSPPSIVPNKQTNNKRWTHNNFKTTREYRMGEEKLEAVNVSTWLALFPSQHLV